MKPKRRFTQKKRAQQEAALTQSSPTEKLWESKAWQLNLELATIVEEQAKQLAQLQQQLQQETQSRLQIETELHQRLERQQLKSEITQQIHDSFSINDILNTAVTGVQQFLQVDRVLVYRFEPDWSGTFVAEAVKDCTPMVGSTLRDPCFTERYIEPYRQGRIQIVDDIYTADLASCHIAMLSTYQVRANLVFPIIYGDTLWGLFILHQCNQPRQWMFWEQEFLNLLITKLAIAIERTKLYDKINQLNTRLEREVTERTAQLRTAHEFDITLKRISDRVRDSLDEAHILQAAVEELATVIGVNCCNASLYDLVQGTSTIYHEYSTFFPSSQGRVSNLAGFPDLYQQLQQGKTFQFCFQQPNPHRGLVSILVSPIFDDNGVLGDLWLIHYPGYGFNESEIRLVQQVATQCAIALRQARLFQAAQAQVKELERLNALKDDFLSTVSHELRSPMSSIRTTIQLLELHLEQLGVLENHPATIQRHLQILHTECQRETNLINDLLDLARLDSNCPLTLTSVDLNTWLPYLVESFGTRTHEHQQQLQIIIPDRLPPLIADLPYLERILTELLHNAHKYTPAGERITVSVWVEESENAALRMQNQPNSQFIWISITNSGVEIPASELSRVFDKFYRIPRNDPWKHGGTGLGLALVKGLVECLGGAIQVVSANNQVEFTMQFPIVAERDIHRL